MSLSLCGKGDVEVRVTSQDKLFGVAVRHGTQSRPLCS